jgi:hypothetical protein
VADVNVVLPEFPGFAVQYDPAVKPYFHANVVQDMRIIASRPIGVDLLGRIAKATPRTRTARASQSEYKRSIIFPDGVNVVVVPSAMGYVQGGYKMDFGVGSDIKNAMVKSTNALHNLLTREGKPCRFHTGEGGSAAEALGDGDTDGTGTISLMKYTNAQILTGKGEHTHSFIVLAHELIHSYHHVCGIKNKSGKEEQWTTGIGEFQDAPMSENAFRDAFGIGRRNNY